MLDDTIVFGQTKEEHDLRLKAALERVQRAGVTLNKEKCEFGKEKLTFLGHLVDSQGIQADPEKIKAVREMNQPENVSELRRFLGMVNQMGKFIINLAELTQPLCELLKKNMKWQWNIPQEEAFIKIKEELCKSTVLSFYDPNRPTKVSADASSYGLEQSYYSNITLNGNQLHMPLVQCQRRKRDIHRLKRKHWLLPGHVTNSQTTLLEFTLLLKLTTNHYSLYYYHLNHPSSWVVQVNYLYRSH